MKSETRSTMIDAPPATVFAFVSQPENLPQWAPAFARAVRRDGDHWVATNAEGERRVKIDANPDCGTVDFLILVAPDFYFRAPTRVVPNGEGSEYIFTLFQAPGMDDGLFAGQVDGLADEFATLRRLLTPA